MSFSLIYLAHQALYRVVGFFRHWYVGGSRHFIHGFVTLLEGLDRTFAFKVTLRYFFKPLYGDYSIPGRFFGFVFRTGRILVGAIVYLLMGVVFVAVYLGWLALPLVVVGYTILSAAAR